MQRGCWWVKSEQDGEEEPHQDVVLLEGSSNQRPFQADQPHCNGLPNFVGPHYNCRMPINYPTHSHLWYPFMCPLPPDFGMSPSSCYLCQLSVNFSNLLSIIDLEFSPRHGMCLHLLKANNDHRNQGDFGYNVLLGMIAFASTFLRGSWDLLSVVHY
jgi:hypothetical protein